jgi:cyclophilin family peptidyl-prolyl cis-trans isomerase
MPPSQEQRKLSASLSRRKRTGIANARWCLLIIMLTPLMIVVSLLYFFSFYNAMVHEEQNNSRVIKEQQIMDLSVGETQHQQMPKSNLRRDIIPQAKEEPLLIVPKVSNAMERMDSDSKKPETLVLTTDIGKIRIVLRPDLSEGSVDYIHRMIDSGVCTRCNFYRAEKPGILQGAMVNKDVTVNTEHGSCPPGSENVHNDCPVWDKKCACYGPLMTRGSVAWAAGQAGGPDFFIDAYKRPARWWGSQHTNFGKIEDDESLKLVEKVFTLPAAKNSGGMTILETKLQFTMELV